MTTARDVIARTLQHGFERRGLVSFEDGADIIISALLSAPEPVRLELAALLNPWRPIETAPVGSAYETVTTPHGTYWRKYLPLPAPPSEDVK